MKSISKITANASLRAVLPGREILFARGDFRCSLLGEQIGEIIVVGATLAILLVDRWPNFQRIETIIHDVIVRSSLRLLDCRQLGNRRGEKGKTSEERLRLT